MPDYYIYQAPTCACGDDPVRILRKRRAEGIAEKAHWCTGTLRMTDGFGNAKYIYNPLSFEDLRAALHGRIDPYLECISMRAQLNANPDESNLDADTLQQCENIRPTVPVLDEQQVCFHSPVFKFFLFY